MSFAEWLSLAAVCGLGAMSPGPSLAVVMKNTLSGGRLEGMKTAVAHGAGVGIYAFGAAAGLTVLITGSPLVFRFIQWLGAAFLAYLGLQSLIGRTAFREPSDPAENPIQVHGLRSGFLTAFLNPKLAIFFAALFSQFVSVQAGMGEKLLMAVTAAVIDTSWYLFVAFSLSHLRILQFVQRKSGVLGVLFGLVLLVVAARILLLAL